MSHGLSSPSLDLNILKAVWDHPDIERTNRKQNTKKRVECPPGSPENHNWRLLKKNLQESLSTRVQAEMKNKD